MKHESSCWGGGVDCFFFAVKFHAHFLECIRQLKQISGVSSEACEFGNIDFIAASESG